MKVSPIAKFNKPEEAIAYSFICPGCNTMHVVHTGAASAVVWRFNEDVNFPTFTPSVLVNGDFSHPDYPRCHSYIREGRIEFLSDCTHALAGQTVEMLEIEE